MPPTSTISGRMIEEGAGLLLPLERLNSAERVTALIAELGWELPNRGLFPPAFGTLVTAAQVARKALVAMQAANTAEKWLDLAIELMPKIKTTVDAIHKLPREDLGRALNAYPAFRDRSGIVDAFPRRLMDYLVITHLRAQWPRLHGGLVTVGVVDYVAVAVDATLFRPAFTLQRLNWDRLPELFSDPVGVAESVFKWNSDFQTELFLSIIEYLAQSFGFAGGRYPQDPRVAAALGTPAGATELRVPMQQAGQWPDTYLEAGLSVSTLQGAGGKGMAIAPYLLGAAELSQAVGDDWELRLTTSASLTGGIALLLRPPKSVELKTDLFTGRTAPVDGRVEVRFRRKSGTEPYLIFGSAKATRLSFDRFGVGVLAEKAGSSQRLAVELEIDRIVFALKAGDSDGFLAKVLPPDGLTSTFDLVIGWSTNDGLYFRGNGTLEAVIPIQQQIGPVMLESVYIALSVNGGIELTLAASAGVRIGPVAASVTRVGIAIPVEFPADGSGNLGPLQIAGPSFKPPTGAGLAIDAGGVSGGGFLDYYKAEQRYAGILTLNFGEIGLTAVGLITTKLPGGKKGFAMLLIIGVEFSPPIQLSFGFTLSGVGGLIGINRTMVVDVLRAGLKSHTLDSILFPEDPILNAAKIISDLSSVFPAEEGRFLIGPMIKIGWGSPNVIEADIGILIELPEPVRVVILGAISASFPSRKNEKIELHLDVLGVIEFAKKSLAIDATLYDSRILSYPLSGDAALRMTWGDKPQFALSVGGFHPRFTPPRGFPDLRRMKLDLSQGGSLQLACTAYHALTSNSLQFGARVDLYAEDGGASLDGTISFDALIYFSPFAFEIDMSGRVVARYKGHKLAGVSLRLTLSGPNPWHAKGKATFEILCWDISARFNRTWGSERVARLDPVNAWAAFKAEIARKESWGTVLPAALSPMDALQPIADPNTPILVHPAGTLEVRQRLLPLDVKLDTLGNAPVSGPRTFQLGVFVAGQGGKFSDLLPTPIEDFFARGQYEELSDKKKVSLPSFEKMQAGLVAGGPPLRADGQAQACPVTYEVILINKEGASSPAKTEGRIPWHVAQRLTRGNAASRAAIRKTGAARFKTPKVGPKVRVEEESYRLADAANLAPPSAAAGVPQRNGRLTRMQADQMLAGHIAAHPELDGKLAVIAGSEAP